MRLIGIVQHGTRWVARIDEGQARPIARVDEFWSAPHAWLDSTMGRPAIALDRVVEAPYLPDRARIFCVGLNYQDHADEGPFSVPEHPTLFGRWIGSVSVNFAPAPVPRNEAGLDWEGEVAVIIGAAVSEASEAQAAAAILGYAVFNDLTARIAQKLTTQWTLGKNGDASGPTGALVTRDETGDPSDGWTVTTRVNDTIVQHANTRDMIFSAPSVISLISHTLTLQPGDMIATGTPAGVGYVRDPPWLLTPGDTVAVSVDHLGTVTTPIVAR